MKVNVEELSQLERRLSIEVPSEIVMAAFDNVYKSIQRDATIKGFRKGKAPLATIKSLYQDRVKGDVVNQLIQEHYGKALDEKSLDPISYPNIQVSTIDETAPFKFTAEFEVRPEVKLEQYEGLPVEKEEFKLDPGHVDKVIENILSSHATRETVLEDRPSQSGDFLVIDFEGFRDGNPVPNTKAEDFELELGSNSFIPGFEDGLTGSKPGQDRTLDLKFPADYHAAELAGTPITFKVKVKGLKKKALPKLDEEFVKRVGFETVEKMRETLAEDHKQSEEKRINDEFKNRLLKALVTRNPVVVPKSMLNDQKELLIKDVRGRLQQQGATEDDIKQYTEKWDGDFSESAKFMIQSSFLVHEIAKKENLVATNEDIEAKMEEYAKQTGIEMARLKTFYAEADNRSRLAYRLTEDKVVDFLKSKAKVREVPKDKLKD